MYVHESFTDILMWNYWELNLYINRTTIEMLSYQPHLFTGSEIRAGRFRGLSKHLLTETRWWITYKISALRLSERANWCFGEAVRRRRGVWRAHPCEPELQHGVLNSGPTAVPLCAVFTDSSIWDHTTCYEARWLLITRSPTKRSGGGPRERRSWCVWSDRAPPESKTLRPWWELG